MDDDKDEFVEAIEAPEPSASPEKSKEEPSFEIEEEEESFNKDEFEVFEPIDDPIQQELNDNPVYKAVMMFFENEFQTAEKIFQQNADKDPLSAIAHGLMKFLKALMSFDDEDIKTALNALERASGVSQAQLSFYREPASMASTAKSAFSSLLGYKQAAKTITNGELRALVIKAETSLLCAMIQLLQENIMAYVKAGLKLRKGYNTFMEAWKFLQDMSEEQAQKSFDKHTLGGLQFGIGSINTCLSLLPGKALALISVFGVRGDPQVGAENLRKSWEGNGVRSPIAAMIILNFHQMKSSFVPHIYNPLVIPDAKRLIEECAERHPKSAIHLLLAGRILRCDRDTERSKQMFKRAFEAQNYWREVRLFAQYELGLTCALELDWTGAAKYMETLYEASYWSKAFYAYFYAVCLDTHAGMTEDPEERRSYKSKAIELYEKVPSLVARTYGGRTLAVEQYVSRKCKIYQKHDYKYTFLPILELMGVWNAFGFMHPSVLSKLKPYIEASLQQIQQLAKQGEFKENESIERAAPLRLVLGVIHRELKDYSQAEKEFESILAVDYKTEKMVSPFTQYEYGIMEYLRNNKKQAKKRFQKAREGYKDYNFEIRLDFRIHLATIQLAQEGF